MVKQKCVLVTGGSGLVGKAIQAEIAKENPEQESWIFLSSKEGNLSNAEETAEIFKKHRPTHVIHLAAKVGGLFDNMNNNLEFLRQNLQINDNVLACSDKAGVVKVVSCLSTCIFPDKTSYPIDETMVHNGPPHPSNFGYSHAKRLIDVLNHAYDQQRGREYRFTSVIPCNVYGPHDNYNLQSGHVIPALIRKVHDVIDAGGDTWTVLGSGKPLRQFIYSQDLAKLIIWTLREYDEVEPIILSVDESDEVTIGDVARLIAMSAGLQGKIVFDTSAADGQMKKTASNAKLRKYLPEFQFTPIEEGIRKSVEWYKLNKATARL